jgi:protein-S-isoprenylcysteine O-methyltransferase Ste14
MTCIRAYYQRITIMKALHGSSSGDAITFKEGWLNITVQGILGLIFLGMVVVYILYPQRMSWAALSLPTWVRWIGAGFGALGLLLFLWTHHTLGENFSPTLHVREKHTLVVEGPYHWVRHPIYTTVYVLVIAFFLLSANWFIGLTGIVGITCVIASRLKREEALMIEKFGDRYREYMEHTGRFLPRFSH